MSIYSFFVNYLSKSTKKKIKDVIPYSVIDAMSVLLGFSLSREIKKLRIIKYLSEKPEYAKEYDWLSHNKFNEYPYDFIKKYNSKKIVINLDEDNRPFYLYKGKRMYFTKFWKADQIKKYLRGLLKEQDADSPHRYEIERIINDDEIRYVADLGTCEGNFALDVIDYVDKLYLFECSDEWVEALKKTFEPYKHKVKIVQKFVSNSESGNNITMDMYFSDKKLDCIKADIEGAEIDMLHGAKKTLEKLRLAIICTYHRQDDAANIKTILDKSGFATHYVSGYRLCLFDRGDFKEPYMRHGVIVGEKQV